MSGLSRWRKGVLLLALPGLSGTSAVQPRQVEEMHRTHDEASMLAQVSQAVLADEPAEGQARAAPGLMAAARQDEPPPVDQELIRLQLDAVKAEQRDLKAMCEYAAQTNAGDACFLEQLKESCERKGKRLQAQYEVLRAIRGDRRKPTTKFFATMNRVRREIWRGLGPLGRNIVSSLSKDVLSVVISQGQITGQVFRVLLRKHVRHEIQAAAMERLARKEGGTSGQSRACDEKPPSEAAAAAPEAEPPDEEGFRLPGDGIWELGCDEQDPFMLRDMRSNTWEVAIDFGSRTFRGSIDRTVYDRTLRHTSAWTEEVSGVVTEDGYLRGSGTWRLDLREQPIAWTGAIGLDLSHVCIARTLQVDLWLTPDWIRQVGRDVFMAAGGACNGLCLVTP